MRLRLLPLLLLIPSPAAADVLSGTKSPGDVVEKSDTIELRLDHGRATLVVRRTFENRGASHDQAVLHIEDMPDGAVATGLRTLGGTASNPVWYTAALLDADVAAKKYRELTGIGGAYPKDPALLSWRTAEHLILQVFPVAPKSSKTVEYTLEAPTHWIAGRHELELPRMGLPMSPPTLTIKAANPKERLLLDGVPIKSGDARKQMGDFTLSLEPNEPSKLGGRFASLGFAKDRALAHVAIEIAPKLSEKPKDAYVVILLDGSRSLSDTQRESEIASARAYLSHLPDAHVQLLVFDRVVRPLEGSFVTMSQARDDLDKLKLVPRNGSDLDLALGEADKRLGEAPKGAPRRMLLLTDLATRSTLTPKSVKALESKATLHVSTFDPHPGELSIARDDQDPWASVPRATGGLLFHTAAQSPLELDEIEQFEEWVRPKRIGRLSVTGIETSVPPSLGEGEAFEHLQLEKTPVASITVKGELWSTPIQTVLATSAAEEKLWAGLAVATSLIRDLNEPEIAALAFKGGAVSPMTSYLAVEPGVRPSIAGLNWAAVGVLGAGRRTKVVKIMAGGVGTADTRWNHLRNALGKIVAQCSGTAVQAKLETTRTEIVLVQVTAKPASAKIEGCVREGLFELELPTNFTGAWDSWEVSVP